MGYCVVVKDFSRNMLKYCSSDSLYEISLVKKKRTLSKFEPTNADDFNPRKDYGRVKIEPDGVKYVYRVMIVKMAETKEELEALKGTLRMPATPKSRKAIEKELFSNYQMAEEREKATTDKAERRKMLLTGKRLSQNQLAARLTVSESNKICDEGQVPSESCNTGQQNPQLADSENLPTPLVGENCSVATLSAKPNVIFPTPFKQLYCDQARTRKTFADLLNFGSARLDGMQCHTRENFGPIGSSSEPETTILQISGDEKQRSAISPKEGNKLQDVTEKCSSNGHEKQQISGDAGLYFFEDMISSKEIHEDNEKKDTDPPCSSCIKLTEQLADIGARLSSIEGILMGPKPTRLPSYTGASTSSSSVYCSNTSVPKGYVDLGAGHMMPSSKIEKIISGQESLQTKIALILDGMFTPNEMKTFYLQSNAKMKLNPDAVLFPEECILNIEKAINDANKNVTYNRVLSKNSKRLQKLIDPKEVTEALDQIEKLAAAESSDVNPKDVRRALTHLFSNARDLKKRKSGEEVTSGSSKKKKPDSSPTSKQQSAPSSPVSVTMENSNSGSDYELS